MAPTSSKTPRRGTTADAATQAAHSAVLADPGKPVKQRLAALAALGWAVLRVPWDTYHRRPQFIVRKVRQLLEARRLTAA